MSVGLRAQRTWYVLAGLVVVALAVRYFPSTHPRLSPVVYWGMGIAGALVLFGSTILHELAHLAVARHFGVGTRGVTLALFGGRAELERQLPTRRGEILLALAGPAMNALLAGIAFLAIGFTEAPSLEPATGVLEFAAWSNALLSAVNVLPVFPLDGGRVVRALLWRGPRTLAQATAAALKVGAISCGTIVVLGGLAIARGSAAAGTLGMATGIYLYARLRAARTITTRTAA